MVRRLTSQFVSEGCGFWISKYCKVLTDGTSGETNPTGLGDTIPATVNSRGEA